jgi:pilus assembly protein CpaB
VGTRRTTMVIAAVVLGAIASLTLYRHLQGIEDQVYADARQVEVVVAAVDVPRGTGGDQAIVSGLTTKLMPVEFRPASAIASIDSIRGKVANLDLPAGTVVVENAFVDPAQAVVNTNAQRIPEGMVAISISVDQVRGVAGLVRPGDKVNMIIDDPNTPETRTKQVLFQNVDVLFVGQTAAPQPGADPAAAAAPADPAGSGMLTLAVPPLAASKIAFVSDAGLYLTLVPPGNQPVPVPPVNGETLFGNELTPGGRESV